MMESINEFLRAIRASVENDTFVRLTISAPVAKNAEVKKIVAKLIILKNIPVFSVVFKYQQRDITNNFPVDEALEMLGKRIENEFAVATLFTVEHDMVIEKIGQRFRLKIQKPVFIERPERSHDKKKQRNIAGSQYLHLLGLADANGAILPSGQDKYRQIHQYIEILKPQLEQFACSTALKVVDMGSGKGYLTFALYEYLTSVLKANAHVTGVEQREDLINLCNEIAIATGFNHLQFVRNTIENFSLDNVDILIALHACDTATDQAICKGIAADASLIVVAPCCHKQIRRELENSKKSHPLQSITRHGIFEERQAEMLTDAIRALILEHYGYMVKVVEFIADAHTHKNVMIIATKTSKSARKNALKEIEHLKQLFGIDKHALERLCRQNLQNKHTPDV